MRRRMAGTLAAVFVLVAGGVAWAAGDPLGFAHGYPVIRIFVNGKPGPKAISLAKRHPDASPGWIEVPVSAVSKALGMKAKWLPKTYTLAFTTPAPTDAAVYTDLEAAYQEVLSVNGQDWPIALSEIEGTDPTSAQVSQLDHDAVTELSLMQSVESENAGPAASQLLAKRVVLENIAYQYEMLTDAETAAGDWANSTQRTDLIVGANNAETFSEWEASSVASALQALQNGQ